LPEPQSPEFSGSGSTPSPWQRTRR